MGPSERSPAARRPAAQRDPEHGNAGSGLRWEPGRHRQAHFSVMVQRNQSPEDARVTPGAMRRYGNAASSPGEGLQTGTASPNSG